MRLPLFFFLHYKAQLNMTWQILCTLFVDNHSIHLRFPKLEIGKVHKVQGRNRTGGLDAIIHILLFQTSGRRNSIFNILYTCVSLSVDGHGPSRPLPQLRLWLVRRGVFIDDLFRLTRTKSAADAPHRWRSCNLPINSLNTLPLRHRLTFSIRSFLCLLCLTIVVSVS